MNFKDQLIEQIENFKLKGKISPPLSFVPANLLPQYISIILVTQTDVTAFAELSSNLNIWKEAISQFQRVYVNNFKSEWGTKNFGLVYFIDEPFSLSLITSIEENKYFCRKYVLTKDNFIEELDRLPFINFSITGPDNIKVFKGARDVLKLCKVNDELAKYLSQSGKSAEWLEDSCLSGKFGAPKIEEIADKKALYMSGKGKQIKPSVRLEGVKIKNFRAYKGEHIFDLRADVVILYGPNGLGKTSFFDAIDFAITGGVKHIEKIYPNDSQKQRKPLKHLSVSEDECSVELYIKNNITESKWHRRLSDQRNLISSADGKSITTHTFIKEIITNSMETFESLNIWRLKNLFRATHLFGQDFSELTEKIETEGVIEGEVLNHLIALQDYYEARNKTEGIAKILIKKQDELKDKEKELLENENNLRQSLRQFQDYKMQEEKLSELFKTIATELKMLELLEPSFSDNFNYDILKFVETITEENKTKLIDKVAILDASTDKMLLFAMQNDRLLKIKNRIKEIDNEISNKLLESDKLSKQLSLQLTENETLAKKEDEQQKKLDNIEWFFYSKTKLNNLDEELDKNKKELMRLDKLGSKLLGDKKNLLEKTQEQTLLIKHKEKILKNIEKLNYLVDRYKNYQMNKNEFAKTQNTIKEAEQKINKTENNLSHYNAEILKLRKELEEIKLKIKKEKESYSPFLGILERIKLYINSEYCPVCNKKHDSKKELLEAIENKIRKYSNNFRKLEKELVDKEKEMGLLNNKINIEQSNLKILVNLLTSEKKKAESLNKEIRKFEINSQPLSLKKLLKNNFIIKKQELENSIKIIEADLKKLNSEINLYDIDSINIHINTLLKSKDEINLKIMEILRNKKFITDELEAKNLDLRQDINILNIEQKCCQEEIVKIKKEFSRRKDLINRLQLDIENIESNIKILNEEHIENQKEALELNNALDEIKEVALKLEIVLEDISSEKLTAVKENIRKNLNSLNVIEEKISFLSNYYEKTKAVKLSLVSSEALKNIEKNLETVNEELAKVERWQRVFSGILKLIEEVQNLSISNYTESFGPAASKIQNKLRKFPGFGTLKLISQEESIAVKIENRFPSTYEQEMLFPNEYLSASQMQVITLSIFLSAALSQTWSSFSTILMDDPVQHFDDLNCNNFVDLIRNLITNNSEGQFQFIISTCDEMFFRILQSKLSPERIKAYRFEEMSENGPIFSQI